MQAVAKTTRNQDLVLLGLLALVGMAGTLLLIVAGNLTGAALLGNAMLLIVVVLYVRHWVRIRKNRPKLPA